MTDRTAFESHFALTIRQQAQHKDGGYKDPITQARWEGWQARESLIEEKPATIRP